MLDSVTDTTANITALDVTGSFSASDKTYDATDGAIITDSSLTGKILGDDVSLVAGSQATFSDKNVGKSKIVTISGTPSLSGIDAGNYHLTGVNSTTASITPAPLSVSIRVLDKTYDATTDATLDGDISLSGVLNTDVVSVTGGTVAFADKNVGTNKAVTLTGASLGGADAGNYEVDLSSIASSAAITPISLTGSFTASNKTYDGNTQASITGRSLSVPGVLGVEDVSLAGGSAVFSDKNVGDAKVVSQTGMALAGSDAGNYVLDSVTDTTANITALEITGLITPSDKNYDGNDAAVIIDHSLAGVINDEVVNLEFNKDARFSDKNVGVGKDVSVSGSSTLSGTDAGNYYLKSVTVKKATISAVHVLGHFTADDKVYDANTVANVTKSWLSGVLETDAVSLIGEKAAFDTKHVGTDKTVTGIDWEVTGADVNNYIFDGVETTTASITKKIVNLDSAPNDKVVDGTDAVLSWTKDPYLDGVVDGDNVTPQWTAKFRSALVGTQPVIFEASIEGDDAGNYELVVIDRSARITEKPAPSLGNDAPIKPAEPTAPKEPTKPTFTPPTSPLLDVPPTYVPPVKNPLITPVGPGAGPTVKPFIPQTVLPPFTLPGLTLPPGGGIFPNTLTPTTPTIPKKPDALPFQTDGKGVTVIDGKVTPLTVNILNNGGGLSATDGTGLVMELSGRAGDGLMVNPDIGGTLRLHADMQVGVNGSGFKPRSLVTLTSFPGGAALGAVMTDRFGKFVGAFALPRSLNIGKYSIQLNGISRKGTVRSLAMNVLLVSDTVAIDLLRPSLAFDISSINGTGLIAAVGLLVFFWFIFAGRLTRDEKDYIDYFRLDGK